MKKTKIQDSLKKESFLSKVMGSLRDNTIDISNNTMFMVMTPQQKFQYEQRVDSALSKMKAFAVSISKNENIDRNTIRILNEYIEEAIKMSEDKNLSKKVRYFQTAVDQFNELIMYARSKGVNQRNMLF